MMGMILNIQHCSMDDGPGIRTTVFLKGCPLHCAWCHNPESQNRNSEYLFRSTKCSGCGVCTQICHHQVHQLIKGSHLLDRTHCILCGDCTRSCPNDALEIAGQELSLSDIMEEILSDRVFYTRSGGGVTISGGEPLAQAAFTYELLKACKQEGLHTCVETCGYGQAEDLLKIAPYTDLFLWDYKLTDAEEHRQYTGVSNQRILKNLALLSEQHCRIHLRCPMIPDVNMQQGHYDGIAALGEAYPGICEIHLLPYHPMGLEKAAALGVQTAYTRKDFLERSDLETVRQSIQKQTHKIVRIL